MNPWDTHVSWGYVYPRIWPYMAIHYMWYTDVPPGWPESKVTLSILSGFLMFWSLFLYMETLDPADSGHTLHIVLCMATYGLILGALINRYYYNTLEPL